MKSSHFLKLCFLKTPKNAFDKLIQDMTDTMIRVTLTNTTTTNTTTVSSTLATSSCASNLNIVQPSSSVLSTLPLRSTSTSMKEKKRKPNKIHMFDDYLVHILKWPVSLIDELGMLFSMRSVHCIDIMNMFLFIEPETGILYKEFLGENVYPVPLLELYSSFDEYEEITLPWLFEETFEEVNSEKSSF